MLWLREQRLNSISVINLSVAVGLVAECVLHFVRTFLDVRGAKSSKEGGGSYEEGRMSVFVGELSTLMAILPLAASDSYIFSTFFYLLVSRVGSGLFSGLMMLPSLLSVLPQKALAL